MNLLDFITDFKYPAIFIKSMVECPVVVVTIGFLINQGYFQLIPAFVMLLGELMISSFNHTADRNMLGGTINP
jgi:hypothetical protein